MKAFNIIWDVDDERDLQFLPTEIDIPEGMEAVSYTHLTLPTT